MTGDEPIPLSTPLAAIRDELGLPEPDALGRLEAMWTDVVGADVAPHARLRTLRNGTLTVAVDAPAWATRLRYARGEILARARAVGGESVRGVHVVVDAPR